MRRGNNLAGKDDGFLKMIFAVGGAAAGRMLCIHVGGADAPCMVRFQPFQGICIQ